MTLIDHTSQTVALRDLGDDEFQARYDCDRFTASVLASRFRYIIEHVSNLLMTYAFSPVIRETADMSAVADRTAFHRPRHGGGEPDDPVVLRLDARGGAHRARRARHRRARAG